MLVSFCYVHQYISLGDFSNRQFYFQGESDDCINRLAKKDGVLAKYVSEVLMTV
jgi:hypothetical protein